MIKNAFRGLSAAILLAACFAYAAGAPTETQGRVRVNGVELYYKAVGLGPPIVVLHGGPGLEHTYLLPEMEVLADEHRLIFYDQRAVGRSSGQADRASITWENYVKDLDELCDALKLEKVILLGHSWGGMLAMFYTYHHPQRVRALILVDSAGASSDFRAPFSAAIETRLTPRDQAELQQTADPSQRDRIVFRAYFHDRTLAERLNLTYTPLTASQGSEVSRLMHNVSLGHFDIHQELEGFKVPTLILHGDEDPLPWQAAEKIHRHIPGSRFVLLKECGHFPMLESPEELFKEIRGFLKDLPD